MQSIRFTDVQPDFCGRRRTSPFPIETVGDGVRLVDQVLSKTRLCMHDVQVLTKAYAQVLLKERGDESVPKKASQDALNKIIVKIQRLAQECPNNGNALISLFYMQNFSPRGPDLKDCFKLFDHFERNSEQTIKIIALFPSCLTPTELDEHCKKLLGCTPAGEFLEVVTRKSEEIQAQDNKSTREAQLKRVRIETNRGMRIQRNYPSHLDELIQKDHLFLFDHLMDMIPLADREERETKIKQLPFSLIARIVMETQAAIIRKVEGSIPPLRKAILFLLGGSGAGKSTTLCYLRGDTMVLKDNCYYSERGQTIIGHDGATSCTFLPSVESVRELAIVDFPGFDDSRGSLISLGMELALKALVKQYSPIVLVLESITNIETRFEAPANLGQRLSRLFENKKNCFLGITKYAKNPDYITIKNLQKLQQNEQRSAFEERTEGLLATIKTLSALNDPKFAQHIERYRNELAQMQATRLRQSRTPPPNNPEETFHKGKLAETEQQLIRETGLSNVIRFCDLENSVGRIDCLNQLSENLQSIRVNPENRLCPEARTLLDERFGSDLLKEIESQKHHDSHLQEIDKLEASIMKSSLVKTLLSKAKPEVGKFLHLPELDPTLVRAFDQKIIHTWIKRCMTLCIVGLNMTSLTKTINEMREQAFASRAEIEQFQKNLVRLKDFIEKLEGNADNPAEAKSVWTKIQKKYAADISAVEDDHQLTKLATILLGIPMGVPLGIFHLVKWKKEQGISKETIQNYSNQLNGLYNYLFRLKEIERTIEKISEINCVLSSGKLSLESENSLEKSVNEIINRVRDIYGRHGWDQRISLLNECVTPPTCYQEALYAASSILNEDLCMVEFGCSQLSNVQESLKDLCQSYKNCVFYTSRDKKHHLFLVKKSTYVQIFFKVMQLLFERTCKEIKTLDSEFQAEAKEIIQQDSAFPFLVLKGSIVLNKLLRAWMAGIEKYFSDIDIGVQTSEEKQIFAKALEENEKGVSAMLAKFGYEGILNMMTKILGRMLDSLVYDQELGIKAATICKLWNIDSHTITLYNFLVNAQREVSWRFVEDWKGMNTGMDFRIPLHRVFMASVFLSRISKSKVMLSPRTEKSPNSAYKESLSKSPRFKTQDK